MTRKKEKSGVKRNDRYDHRRRRYVEVHGKIVDFINHGIEDGTLYFTVRFQDKTNFSVRYWCDMRCIGVELGDLSTGNLQIIRAYKRDHKASLKL